MQDNDKDINKSYKIFFKIKQNGYQNVIKSYQNYYQTPKVLLNLMYSTGFSTFLVHT